MKKVLIITYYWPPAGGPGVQRVLKFAKCFFQFGWEPIILTVKNGEYPAIDESLVNEIPTDIKVYKTKSLEPFSLFKKFTGQKSSSTISKDITNRRKNESFLMKIALFIRGNFFVPDARIGWILQIVSVGKKIIEKHNVDIIFSSSPPHSLHLGAKRLAKKTNTKWIADFRDPWHEAYWKKDLNILGIINLLDKKLEKSVLANANGITTVSNELIESFSSKVQNNYYVILNGFESLPISKTEEKLFKIIFFGNLTKFQNPGDVFKAVASLENRIKSKIKIEFIGKVFDDFINEFEKYDKVNYELLPYKPYKELMKYAQSASILFFPYYQNFSYSKGMIGAKLFDYLALKKPILALGEKGSVADRVLTNTKRGKLIEYNDIDEIAKFVVNIFRKWEEEKFILLDDNNETKMLETKENIKQLTMIFEDTLNA